jgi:peroxiredoxin
MKLQSIWATASLVVGTLAATLSGSGRPPQDAPAELKVGDTAPGFSLQGSDGKVHKLSDYKGKTVVLAWFPKAFTGG